MKPKFEDIKTLVVCFPIECGFMVDWDGKNYNLNDEDELREWKNDYGIKFVHIFNSIFYHTHLKVYSNILYSNITNLYANIQIKINTSMYLY